MPYWNCFIFLKVTEYEMHSNLVKEPWNKYISLSSQTYSTKCIVKEKHNMSKTVNLKIFVDIITFELSLKLDPYI